ncbi:DUF7475 family protein [Halomarina pelagica]|uniref:DUF7475 family protein n=1 Tax=Halomarina pelagica TaxID=2961599 RepID=UPI0020C3A3B4|nr:hypothetical protein [Halomarina sp. BND7]
MATTAADGFAFDTSTLSGLHWAAIALAALSGTIHLWLGVEFVAEPVGIAFLLAGLGFFGAIALVLLDYRRRLIYLLGIPFTAVQIALWYQVNVVSLGKTAGELGVADYVDKVAQVLLLALLVALLLRDR